jgi:hypothetical protein
MYQQADELMLNNLDILSQGNHELRLPKIKQTFNPPLGESNNVPHLPQIFKSPPPQNSSRQDDSQFLMEQQNRRLGNRGVGNRVQPNYQLNTPHQISNKPRLHQFEINEQKLLSP